MSPRFPVVNAIKLIKALEKKGFVIDRQSGSHIVLLKSHLRVTIPDHGKRDVAIGTLRQILKDAEISVEELRELL